MKKYFALILCLVMCLSLCLAGCDKKDVSNELEELAGMTPEEAYNNALEMLKSVDNFESIASQEIKVQGMTVYQEIISRIDGQNMYVKTENDMGLEELEMTYVDGVVYMNQGGSKEKFELSYEDLDAQYESMTGSSLEDSLLMSLPSDWFSGTTFVKAEDGYTVTMYMSAEKYTEYLGKLPVAGMSSVTFPEDIEYVIYFDAEGVLEKVVINITMEVMGVEATAVSTSTFTFGGVTITAPADADTYH